MRKFLNLVIGSLLLALFGSVQAETHFTNLEQTVEDTVITAKVSEEFAKNRFLNPLKIHISTKNGRVTLRGNVKDRQIFVDMLRLAKDVKGVKSVNIEELLIRQVNTVVTDAYITAKVEAAVLKAKVFDDESIPIVGINATTSNGIVMISGAVKDEKSMFAIIRRVNAVRGVKKIISRLVLDKG